MSGGIVDIINGYLWGGILIVLILATGIYLSVRTGFIQVRHLKSALKLTLKDEENAKGEVSSFGALCISLSATVGTGNIVGVASAVCTGGPGALFWMIFAAFFGMATKYAEGMLAVKYREDKGAGHFLGGPYYYIEKGMGNRWKWLAKLFAFFGLIAGIMGIGTLTQVNGITAAVSDFFDKDKLNIAFSFGNIDYTAATVISGLTVTVCAAAVIIGGVGRIAKVSETAVPFMSVLYVTFALLTVICNIEEIPRAVALILKSAFDVSSLKGAIAGITVKAAMQKGIGRGIFSNEAGLGSAPIAAATSRTREPVRGGLVTMTATLIDTIIICTVTGLSIVITDAWNGEITGKALEGVEVTAYAWEKGLPFNERFSSFVLMLCLTVFAFTTVIGWNFYAERCLEYFTNGSKKALKIYRFLYIGAVLTGPYLTVSTVFDIADLCNGLMALPNLIALISLGGVVSKETKSYFKRMN